MTVKEFIRKLNELGYDDNTTLDFYHLNGDSGDTFELKIEEIEDNDRKCGIDSIGVLFEKPSAYIKSECGSLRIDIQEKLQDVVNSIF